jgi:DNA-binding response OmpR family regulator
MKILISDPDWHFSRQAAGYLEGMAHLVVHQADTNQALELARRWEPDVVILAAESAEAGLLEELCESQTRPAILLTEYMDRYDRAWRAWQIGGDELLMKPVFESRELHDAIVAARENAATGVRTAVTAQSA